MGLAMKVALRAKGPDRLDLPLHCSVDRILERQRRPLMPFQCWPFGRDYVQGWIGGSVAWDLARLARPRRSILLYRICGRRLAAGSIGCLPAGRRW